ncbi:MAG: hypothetical protein EXR92_07095 [Gemmatimonadetes bacterium]|nr:hypothetical protein [Gemmatimonadota bacterium]
MSRKRQGPRLVRRSRRRSPDPRPWREGMRPHPGASKRLGAERPLEKGKSPRGSDVMGLLGLARRAGAVALGVDATRQSLNSGRVRLVLLAADASHKQLDKVRGLALRGGIPVRWVSDRALMGRAVGAGPLSVVGVTAGTFAEQLLRGLPEDPPPRVGGDGPPDEREELEGNAGR